MEKILKRCDICKRWGAAYLIPAEPRPLHVCIDCWKAKFAPPQPGKAAEMDKKISETA
ncbi:MAG TPA: hypothetical protein PKW33_06850 [Anaerolineaceae bacterium]|nr:hypothetical protein [Anaerolineaceae bacterium]HPN51287.1 hypothetical protein [Anaerolineaceae bacterium]